MTTQDLERLMELAATYPYAVIDSVDNTDGEGVWHCDVEFYDEQGDEDPINVFSFNATRDDYSIATHFAREDVKQVAEDMGVAEKLEDRDIDIIAGRYSDEHDMTIADRTQIEQHISNYLHYDKKGE